MDIAEFDLGKDDGAVVYAEGSTALTITFGDDTSYGATATSSAVVVFGYETGVAFVVGDRSRDLARLALATWRTS